MLRYAITSRVLFSADDHDQRSALCAQAAWWARDGIDFIQLREKDLGPAALAALARDLLHAIVSSGGNTKLLINSRPDVAIAAAAHGVHLTSAPGELTPAQVRSLFAAASLPAPIISLSCHTPAEVSRARNLHADSILFAPVFEKPRPSQSPLPGLGLDRLREACVLASGTPVYALGGVTLDNAPSCLEAGAAGLAGIRLFLR